MSREEKDQAEQLRSQVEEAKEKSSEKEESLNLPPRSEVHGGKEKKTKLKMKYPLVRLLALIFLLLVLIIPGYALLSHNKPVTGLDGEDTERDYSETVELENNSEERAEQVASDDFDIPKDNEKEEPLTSNNKEQQQQVTETKQQANKAVSADKKEQVEKSSAATHPNIQPGKPEPAPAPKPKQPEYITYVVKPEDNLFRISLKFYGSRSGEELIKQANNLQADGTVYEGQRLKIPQ
ncbi:LysM domain-containing protein [Bacillus tianshenii]|nr:LysM domain-containing protein [Bacillus tianshenii]